MLRLQNAFIPSWIKISIRAIPALYLLTGCAILESAQTIGDVPPLTRTQNPIAYSSYEPVTMPMPMPIHARHKPNSLWRPGARAFFKDQRASRVGDILTVMVNFSDKASLTNTSTLSRKATNKAAIPNFFGLEKKVEEWSIDPKALISSSFSPSQQATGSINRADTVAFNIAATVTQVLPNGNLVISGRQEFRFNTEVRDLLITGVVRPQDILADNTISHEKIGEARLAYGGRGAVSDLHKVPPGQQLLNLLTPF